MESAERETGIDTDSRRGGGKTFRSRRRLWWAFAAIGILLVAGTAFYWFYASRRETTDDAQIDGHIHAISPRVGGMVDKLFVKDNQFVEAGTTLVQIDPKDYQVAVERARADLAEAEAKLHVDNTEVPIVSTTTTSQLSSAQA